MNVIRVTLFLALLGCTPSFFKRGVTDFAERDAVFTGCSERDGGLLLRVYRSGGYLGGGEVEWRADHDKHIATQYSSGFGITDIDLVIDDAKVTIEGRLKKSLPELSISKKSFLKISGHSTGLKVEELPCLLTGRLPQAWAGHIRGVARQGENREIDLEHDGREIMVQLNENTCTTIRFSEWILFSREVRWCCESHNKSCVLELGDSYRLEWSPSVGGN